MALYFFHSQTDSRDTDTDGTELATPQEARSQAITLCGQMMRDAPDTFWGSRPWSVTVTNDTGLILWQLSMDGYAAPGAVNLT